jgi:threonyl-tRNA synthetase
MLVVGQREQAQAAVSVREHGGEEEGSVAVAELGARLALEIGRRGSAG